MCLLNLNNPSKQCVHTECQTQNTNIFHQYYPGHYPSEPATFRPEDKKRAPIQSISEILAENILKKLKDDSKNNGHNIMDKEKHQHPVFYDLNSQVTPEAFYFQNQILLLMNQQMHAISETSNSLDKTFTQMKFLQQEIIKTKEIFVQNQKKIEQKKPKIVKQENNVSPLLYIPKPGKVINKEQLLVQLYGQNREFKYQIQLNSTLDTPFYRERNFRFSVALYDNQNNKISNSNRIPLSLALYTSENMPKIIETNTIGIPILKGSVEKDLVGGMAEFEKLQIKEVTSHFRNGWIFFIVYAKMPSIFAKNSKNDKKPTGIDIDFMDIRPLILENVMVKAKKMKNRKDVKLEEGKDEDGSDQESNSKSNGDENDLVLSEKE